MSKIHNKDGKKRALLRQQRGRCWLCGLPMPSNDATFDHIIPRSKLGTSMGGNLKLSHRLCNNRRGSSMDAVFVESDGIVALRWNVRSIGHL